MFPLRVNLVCVVFVGTCCPLRRNLLSLSFSWCFPCVPTFFPFPLVGDSLPCRPCRPGDLASTFLVIIPQPIATSSDQCVGGKNVAIRVIQTAPRSRPSLQSLAAQHLVQRQSPPPRVGQEVRSERKDYELLSCWSTPLDSGPRSALSCPCWNGRRPS